jgi:hypothetical protein
MTTRTGLKIPEQNKFPSFLGRISGTRNPYLPNNDWIPDKCYAFSGMTSKFFLGYNNINNMKAGSGNLSKMIR